jgi:hypothetical protein
MLGSSSKKTRRSKGNAEGSVLRRGSTIKEDGLREVETEWGCETLAERFWGEPRFGM